MKLLERARTKQVDFPATVSTPYVNTIPADAEPWFPGDEYQERRIRAYIRWNAAAMVTRANTRTEGIGGHLSTYASSAALYEVGFNHFFRGKADGGFGDQVFIQGHASPGIYARAFVEGRLTEDAARQLPPRGGRRTACPAIPTLGRCPTSGSSPRSRWGSGPINAIYQAHVNRYLNLRRLVDTSGSRVWCFVGDGEMDEPESIGALGVAGREHLDNLIFVVNCNLQRLDGPVRGNGKIIQELEAVFRGAGWNVIKVIWGSRWDALLATDVDGVLLDRMNTHRRRRVPEAGRRVRGLHPRALLRPRPPPAQAGRGPERRRAGVAPPRRARLPQALRRLQARHRAAGRPDGHPGQDHQGMDARPRDRGAQRHAPDQEDDQGAAARAARPPVPHRRHPRLGARGRPALRPPARGLRGHGVPAGPGPRPGRPVPLRVVRPAPRLPARPQGLRGVRRRVGHAGGVDDHGVRPAAAQPGARPRRRASWWRPSSRTRPGTFGLEPLIAEAKIYAPEGQHYVPVDADLPLNYAESASGQVLQEGITEAGALASFIALATAYATWGQPMVPVYLFYSMFGFQRVGDLAWALGDMRGRGILAGCTAGRTTLHGRGPPARRRALAPPGLDQPGRPGLRRLLRLRGGHHHRGGREPRCSAATPEDRFWYLTLYNENYPMPPLPEGAEGEAVRQGVIDGIYRFAPAPETHAQGEPAGVAVLLGADVERRRSRRSASWPSATASPPTPGR